MKPRKSTPTKLESAGAFRIRRNAEGRYELLVDKLRRSDRAPVFDADSAWFRDEANAVSLYVVAGQSALVARFSYEDFAGAMWQSIKPESTFGKALLEWSAKNRSLWHHELVDPGSVDVLARLRASWIAAQMFGTITILDIYAFSVEPFVSAIRANDPEGSSRAVHLHSVALPSHQWAATLRAAVTIQAKLAEQLASSGVPS